MIKREDTFSIPIFTYDYEDGELKGIHVGNRRFVPADDAESVASKLHAKICSKDANDIGYDSINPAHYISDGLECIDAIKASMSSAEFVGYLRGNVIKYIWRFRDKGGVEDLKKARWYIKRLIKEEKKHAKA